MSIAAVVGYNGNPIGERPYWGSPDTKRGTNLVDVEYTMNIKDLRSLTPEERNNMTVDKCGFEVISEPVTAENVFASNETIQDLYYKQCEEIYKRKTGCSSVKIFDHTVRRARWGMDSQTEGLGPALRVHVDQSGTAAVMRVRENMGDDADRLLKGRYQIVNLWRPLIGPVKRSPLAMVDYRTLDVENDTVESDVYFPTRAGMSLSVRYNPNHKWYYMSDMTPDQVILLKCYDSEPKAGRSIMTPHTSFTHPDTPENWPTRQSIEIRALLFFEDESA